MKQGDDTRNEHAKKPYSSPSLTAYGTVRTATQAVGPNGMGDGGGGGHTRNMTSL